MIKSEKVYIEVSISIKDDVFCIRISDNGEGIDKEKLDKINLSYQDCTGNPQSINNIGKIQFGGMGLIGTLLRLHLYFGDHFTYKIDSDINNGTTVLLCVTKSQSS